MPASPPLAAVLADVFYCLGLGVGLAVLRQLAGLLAGRGWLRDFLLDVLGFAAGAVAVFGFAAGRSAVGVARWYMAAGAGLGVLGWQWSGAELLRRGAEGLVTVLGLPRRAAARCFAEPLRRRKQRRKADKKAKKEKNRLQKRGRVIYN